MGTLKSLQEDCEALFQRFRNCCQQQQARDDDRDNAQKENEDLKQEIGELKRKLRRLEVQAGKRYEAENAMRKAEWEVSKAVEDGLKASLAQAELKAKTARSETEHVLGMLGQVDAVTGASRDEVAALQKKVAELEKSNASHVAKCQVLFPLAWCGALVRIGRLENAVRRVWGSESKHTYSDEAIGRRNRVAHDGDIAADIALPSFIARHGSDDERESSDQIRRSFSKYKALVEEEFGRTTLECKALMKNDKVKRLLIARSTIWAKRRLNVLVSGRANLLKRMDLMIERYKVAVSEDSTVDPFSKDSVLASDLDRLMSEVRRLLDE